MWGSYLSYLFFFDVLGLLSTHPMFVVIVCLCNLALNALNVFWFYQIVQKAILTLNCQQDIIGKRD